MEKNKLRNLKVVLYISLWVIVWGTVASLIDLYLFLDKGIYNEGEFGQYLTFTLTAMISIFLAKKSYSKLNL